MTDTPREIIELMALADQLRRPMRRYQNAVSDCTWSATDSDENDAAQERGSAALREVDTLIRSWIRKHPDSYPVAYIYRAGTNEAQSFHPRDITIVTAGGGS